MAPKKSGSSTKTGKPGMAQPVKSSPEGGPAPWSGGRKQQGGQPKP